jgi:hypothetical protein
MVPDVKVPFGRYAFYPSRWPRGALYPQKLVLTSPTSGCRSVGIVRSWSQATEFSLCGFFNAEIECSLQVNYETRGIAYKSCVSFSFPLRVYGLVPGIWDECPNSAFKGTTFPTSTNHFQHSAADLVTKNKPHTFGTFSSLFLCTLFWNRLLESLSLSVSRSLLKQSILA